MAFTPSCAHADVYVITLLLFSDTYVKTRHPCNHHTFPLVTSTHQSLYPKQIGGAGAACSGDIENTQFCPGSVLEHSRTLLYS